MNEEILFHLARKKSADERVAFLDEACAGDADFRQRVEVLLRAHEASGTNVAQSQSDNRRFQFGLASLFLFVTGVCVAFSLVRWNYTYGLMAAILAVGGGWSFAAMRAGYHRLAYTLATPAIGVAGHLALIVPMFILREHRPRPSGKRQ